MVAIICNCMYAFETCIFSPKFEHVWTCHIFAKRGTSQAHENVAIEVRRSDETPLATELSWGTGNFGI